MAFCGSCGAQLEGDGRFCVQCGADQTAKAGGAPAVQAAAPQAPAPQAAIPPQPVQPFAGMPPQYPPPHVPIPVMAMPPAAPAKGNTWLWGVIIVGGILYGLYYIGTHNQQNPGQTPTPQAQPGQQPGGQGNPNQAVIQAQRFTGSYNAVNGTVQVTQGQWLNGSNVPLAAARLGCEQLDANGQGLTQDQVTLTGPAQPGQTVTLPTFSIGAEAQGAAKVNCQITAVETVNN